MIRPINGRAKIAAHEPPARMRHFLLGRQRRTGDEVYSGPLSRLSERWYVQQCRPVGASQKDRKAPVFRVQKVRKRSGRPVKNISSSWAPLLLQRRLRANSQWRADGWARTCGQLSRPTPSVRHANKGEPSCRRVSFHPSARVHWAQE